MNNYLEQNYKMGNKKLTIAIDGHSSCGKSTVAKQLAKKLHYTYIDSGAMYRLVTLFAMRNQLIENDTVNTEELTKRIDEIKIDFRYNEAKEQADAYLNGELVEDEIRSLAVSNNVSIIAAIKFVREKMVDLQRELSRNGGVVMDGRDIGTVVFPNADLKIFMTADAEVRAERRFKELQAKGDNVTFKEILENVKKRDFIDENRDESPLRKANDAIVLDNSNFTPTEQLKWLEQQVERVIVAK